MKLTPTHIQSARRHLRAADPVMRSMIDAVGPYTLRFEKDRFGMLVRSIVSQQISTIAGRATPQTAVGTGWFRGADGGQPCSVHGRSNAVGRIVAAEGVLRHGPVVQGE